MALKVIDSRQNVDAKAFEILVRLHHRRLIAYALALTSREDVAEDLVQDAFLIAHRDLAKFDTKRDFGAWVRGIVRMKYLEWTRSTRTQVVDAAVLDSVEERHRTWDRAVEDGREDALTALRGCLAQLSGHLGDAVALFYTEKRPCGEIAERLGVEEAVVRKRLQRARESLAGCLKKKLEEAPHGA
jgi:RNA polymerase sigma factor (sigma-70 family)